MDLQKKNGIGYNYRIRRDYFWKKVGRNKLESIRSMEQEFKADALFLLHESFRF
jgi:hypothetical protein